MFLVGDLLGDLINCFLGECGGGRCRCTDCIITDDKNCSFKQIQSLIILSGPDNLFLCIYYKM